MKIKKNIYHITLVYFWFGFYQKLLLRAATERTQRKFGILRWQGINEITTHTRARAPYDERKAFATS